VAILSQRAVDQSHRVRVGRVAAAGLVGGEEDFGAFQSSDPNVLADIGVICPNCYTAWRLPSPVDGRCAPFISVARRAQRCQYLFAELGTNPDVGTGGDFVDQ
jgi:hypothetical protein